MAANKSPSRAIMPIIISGCDRPGLSCASWIIGAFHGCWFYFLNYLRCLGAVPLSKVFIASSPARTKSSWPFGEGTGKECFAGDRDQTRPRITSADTASKWTRLPGRISWRIDPRPYWISGQLECDAGFLVSPDPSGAVVPDSKWWPGYLLSFPRH